MQIGTMMFVAVPVAAEESAGMMIEAIASTVVSANKVAMDTDEGLAAVAEVQCWARCNFLVAGEAAAFESVAVAASLTEAP